jgi:hypothetical protein
LSYRIFEVPDYHEFLDVLGVFPEPVDEHGAGRLAFEIGDETLEMTYDILGRSINCRWSRDSMILAEIFREGAVKLRLGSAGPRNYIAIDFATDSQAGFLEIQLLPSFRFRDKLLLQ